MMETEIKKTKHELLVEKSKIIEYWSRENRIQEVRGYFNLITQNMLDKHLNYPSGGRIIDIGCGTGRTLSRYKERGARVIGVDLSVECAQIAKEKGLNVVIGDARKLPIKTDFFDASINLGVFEHFAEIHTAISEQVRVTKNKGSVVVIIQNKWTPLNPFIKIFEFLRGKSKYGVVADGYKYSYLFTHLKLPTY